MQVKRGDVVDVNLGSPPEEIKGHEQGFIRPCVVMKALSPLKLAIVVPLTSKASKKPFYSVVALEKGFAGLKFDSFALCHQIRTISFDRIFNRRGQLSEKDFLKIQGVLADLLEL
jgi:mRNA interferase MazF